MSVVQHFSVEVIYALPTAQRVERVQVSKGATVREVIELSGVLDRYPEINLALNKVGIFGKLRELHDVVHAGDRVEIYRPLQTDPKEAHRRRAARS